MIPEWRGMVAWRRKVVWVKSITYHIQTPEAARRLRDLRRQLEYARIEPHGA